MHSVRKKGSKDSHVKVYVRVRPSSDPSCQTVQACVEKKQIVLQSEESRKFTFDGVFDSEHEQKDIFDGSVKNVLNKFIDGFNVSVIAYGQTGSGKTYTMGINHCDQKEDEGIIQQCLQYLLNSSETKENEHLDQSQKLCISFIEIYSETAYDLLSETKEPLSMKNNENGGLTPMNCTKAEAGTVSEALEILETGRKNRNVASTIKNSVSSRSHAVLTISFKEKGGILKLIDLAGAEGVGRNHQEGKGFSEGVAINQSLLALGKVLSALSSTTNRHVSFRESLLTRILQESLGGNCFTVMVACISPEKSDAHVTLNTLRYAEQACNIKNKPCIMSTVKRNAYKRPFLTANTPMAWKKKNIGDSPLNATIASPGFKASTIKKPLRINNTFMHPLPSATKSSVAKRQLMSSHLNLYSPPPFDPSNVIGSETELHTKGIPPEFSPLINKMQSRFEQSMMEMQDRWWESKLDCIEDRVAEKVAKILYSKEDRRKSTRLQMKNLEADLLNDSQELKNLTTKITHEIKEEIKPMCNMSLDDTVIIKTPIKPKAVGDWQPRRSRRLTNRLSPQLSSTFNESLKDEAKKSPLKNLTNTSFDHLAAFSRVRRNPSRRSALVAQQKNFEIFNSPKKVTRRSRAVVKKLEKTIQEISSKKRKSAQTPKSHENTILDILNEANVKQLQKLPMIGPKTAVILHNYSKFYGTLSSISDLRKVEALPKTFYQRFIKANMLDVD